MAKVLRYDPMVYIPQITIARSTILPDVNTATAKGKAEADRLLRQEYSRLRAIAQKRLARLGASEFREDMPYQRYKDRLPTIAEMKAKAGSRYMSELAKALSDVASFVSMQTSTIAGARERQRKVLEGLEAHGVEGVTSGNLREFGKFMEILRSKLLDRIYDSKRAYQVYSQARRLGMKWHGDLEKEFDYFYKNVDKMKNLHKLTDKEKRDIRSRTGRRRMRASEYYREALEDWKLQRKTSRKGTKN